MLKLVLLLLLVNLFQSDERQTERDHMVVYQIQDRGVKDKLTIEAMRKVDRHKLVPSEVRHLAYQDGPLPIGFGQTISQPYIVAYMTESIRPEKIFKVLEIGTGSGYQAAILAEIVAEVYTVEIVEDLGKRAAKDLRNMGYQNIHFKIGDGYYGWQEHAPYDAIIVTAASEQVPPPLLEQLKDGGRMIIPVGSPFLTQQLVIVEKKGEKIRSRNLMPVRFVPFTRSK